MIIWQLINWLLTLKKQSSHCKAMEHLESIGSKIIMNGPSVRKLRE